jgi:hypothetical protein
LVINKTFIPEYTGEWGGGLIQVNTKDIPNTKFFNAQIGVGGNSNTMGKDFYTSKGGKLDFLGFRRWLQKITCWFPSKMLSVCFLTPKPIWKTIC